MRFKEFLTEATVRDQILSDFRNAGGNIDDYYVRFTDQDKLGYSAKQAFGRSPDVNDPAYDLNYIGYGKGRPALWFYPLSYYLSNKDLYATKQPYAWLVRLKPNAWLQTVDSKTKQVEPAPNGKERVGIMKLSFVPSAVFFKPAFDVVGKYYDYAGQHQRHGKVKGRPAPTFMDRLRGVNEVRSDDDPETNYYDADDGFSELKVSERIQKYFYDRGYGYLGEGRDQMAFLTPRGTVLKVLGIGEDEREDIVKTYVGFFMRNQRNPHYPRIYNAGDFAVDGETYFLYEMEYLNPVHGEERVLYYIEELMSALPRGEHALQAFYKNTPRPPELDEQQIDGLVMATQDLEDAIGGQAPLDLRSIENLGRRDNGQLVIIDPFSL